VVPVAPSAEWVERLRAELPELPAVSRAKRQQVSALRRIEGNVSSLEIESIENAGASDLIAQTIEAGAQPENARKWWLGELLRRANESGIGLADLPVTPADVARVAQLEVSGTLTDKLARQVLDGVLAGEGGPDDVVAARGLAVVSDDATLLAAVDEAIAANQDVAAKVRAGKTAAAGALVGAVMKATRGQADAARARELILQRLTQP